jgi:hypothetical protein
MQLLTPRCRWDVCSIAKQFSRARPDLYVPKVPNVQLIDCRPRKRLDYPLRTRNILCSRHAAALKGENMRRAINFDNLSAADKKELKALLQQQKKALEDAIKATNEELYDLMNPGKAKKAKKTKKAKKAKT